MENRAMGKTVRYINLPHLFWYFLQQIVTKWYLFLIVILAGTIAGAGYATMKNVRMNNLQNDIGRYLSVSEEEFASVQAAAKLYDDLEEQKEYNEQSILMKCGNLMAAQASALYQAETGDEYKNHQIAAVYESLFYGDELYQWVVKDIGEDLDVKYLREVFEVTDLEGGLFEIKVISFSIENAEEMLQSVKEYLNEKKKQIEETMKFEYDITLLNEVSSEGIVEDLKEKKDVAETSLVSLQAEYDDAVATLSINAQKYFYLYLEERFNKDYIEGGELLLSESFDMPEIENNLAKRRLMIDTVLGFVLGVCCICGYFAINYCWSLKLVNGEELINMYGLNVYGYFIEEKKRKKVPFWFLKKQKKGYVLKTPSAECKEVIERLKLKFSGEDRIFLVSTCDGADLYEDLLEEEGKKQGIRLVKGGDILKTPFALEELKKSDYVFFIEKEGVSKYEDINKEIQFACEAEKRIIGIMVIV